MHKFEAGRGMKIIGQSMVACGAVWGSGVVSSWSGLWGL